jgi:hypothetical protein
MNKLLDAAIQGFSWGILSHIDVARLALLRGRVGQWIAGRVINPIPSAITWRSGSSITCIRLHCRPSSGAGTPSFAAMYIRDRADDLELGRPAFGEPRAALFPELRFGRSRVIGVIGALQFGSTGVACRRSLSNGLIGHVAMTKK